MNKRVLGFLLAILMLGCNVCAAAEAVQVEPRASLYLDGYAIGIVPKGGHLMSVTFIVYGTDIMDCLGAQKILIEEWDGIDWVETGTYSAEKNSHFLAQKASEHAASVTFYGLPGVQYRATLTAYAELNGGSDTGVLVSSPKTCK